MNSAMKNTLYNVPNLLCYFRVAVIPAMTLLFFFDNAFCTWLNVILFSLAGISDWLDGAIARATGQTTLFGKFLDSSTDKMLVGAALILLVAFDRLTGIWMVMALVIFLREILIAGVREFMALQNVSVPISKMGKWKLTAQVVAIGFLVAGDYGDALIPHTMIIGKALFFAATVMTVLSGWEYLKEAYIKILLLDDGQDDAARRDSP